MRHGGRGYVKASISEIRRLCVRSQAGKPVSSQAAAIISEIFASTSTVIENQQRTELQKEERRCSMCSASV